MIIIINQPDAATLQARARASASITRREFCLGLATTGVLERDDAIAAAQGQWPAAMADFLAYLDAGQSLDAQIEWAAAGSIERMHPFVLSLASWLSMPDADVDALFGITTDG